MTELTLNKISETCWEIPKSGGMRVPGRIFADERLMAAIRKDKAADQVANVAWLPGIVGYALAMPDAHWGYGFPIGGVAATNPEAGGVVSPGGVGYDINCGCRLMTTHLRVEDVRDKLYDVVNGLYRDIPCGVGSSGAIQKLTKHEMTRVLERGAAWAVEQGYGTVADLDTTEENGRLSGADASALSERAVARGENQLGTLGSGNHFAEVGIVERVFDGKTAEAFGLTEGYLTLLIHSGSRGLGYQVCDDFIRVMLEASGKYGFDLPDKQLCCAPVESPEGRHYMAAMAAAANYAWANRQIMMELARRSMQHVLKISPRDLGGRLVYDVCHNIAKLETHDVDGSLKRLCVHRKGATRAFPGGREEVPSVYREAGQPVLIPGDMGTGSYVCAGTERALTDTFGSACHGAGRLLSRTAARKAHSAGDVLKRLKEQDIVVMARNKKTVVEEAPGAYKDIDAVVDVLEKAGLARRVARIRPLGVVKG